MKHDDADRARALEQYAILDSGRDPAYDNYTRLVADICKTKVASIALIDASRSWTKAAFGMQANVDTPRELTFCNHAIESEDVFEIRDATLDPRFASNPFVTNEPNVRFYAGVPLVDRDGFALGMLCTFDSEPRVLSEDQRGALRRLGASLVRLIESRKGLESEDLDRQGIFTAAFDRAADPIAILRLAGPRSSATIVFANRAFGQLFGYDPSVLTGNTLGVLDGPNTDPMKMARLHDASLAREPGSESTFLYASSGAARFVELRERVIDANHRILTVRDLTRVRATQQTLSETNQRLTSLLENNTDAVLTIDGRGLCVKTNPAARAVFGLDEAELANYGYLTIAPNGVFPNNELVPRALAEGATMDFEATFRDVAGTPIEMECKAIPMFMRGRADGAYLVFKDVTEAKNLARVVEEQAKRTRSLYLISAEQHASGRDQIDRALALVIELLDVQYGYVGRLDGDSIVLDHVVGTGVRSVRERIPLEETRVAETLAHGDVLTVADIASDENRRANVRSYDDYHGYVSAPLIIDGKAYGAMGFLSKRITHFNEFDCDFVRLVSALVSSTIERHVQRQKLHDLAFRDTLTGLPNRTKFMQALSAAFARRARHAGSFALHYIDLDGFKSVNDRGGHAVGDEVLAEVARRLRATVRPYDATARFGGDEFVVLQAEASGQADVEALAQRIVDILSEPYETSGGTVRVGASVGVAIVPQDACDAPTLLRSADVALYRAKALGKRRVAFAATEAVAQ